MTLFAKLNHVDKDKTVELLKVDLLHKYILEHYSVNQSDPNFFNFLFVRHPFSRLVSAYEDKIVNKRQDTFVKPLVNHKLRTLRTKLKETPSKPNLSIHFSDFVDFVLHELSGKSVSYGTLHWLPASWLCKVCDTNYDFVGKVESLSSDVRALSEKFVGLRENLSSFKKKVNSRGKSDLLTKEYLSQLSEQQLSSLREIYREDFDLFGYDADQFMNVSIEGD